MLARSFSIAMRFAGSEGHNATGGRSLSRYMIITGATLRGLWGVIGEGGATKKSGKIE